ncbi:ras-related protein Rab-1A-like [Dendronephthya gigantea]|uniref:ras-related protein Rab-1A-like n=1 Tax=Dendronephthya gigantea TaxID=151771 RepID=UPI00106BBD6D|nr:ras-related protein Rab-1A-like [Dendronephthya gigantea]
MARPGCQDEPKYSFKIIVLGSKGVGKSSLLKRFQFNEFEDVPSHTIGVGLSTHSIEIGSETVQMTLWDTAGEERFKSITSQYYRNADAAIIVFDLTSKRSFEEVKDHWIPAFRKVVGSTPYIALVGNKKDLLDRKQVDHETFKDLANLYCIHPWETSAKDSTNVKELFNTMGRELIQRVDQLQSLETGPDSLFLHNIPEDPQDLYSYCTGGPNSYCVV